MSSFAFEGKAGTTLATSHQGSDFYGNTVMEKYIMSI